ncbi:XRE family transcriptional regulator [Ralstonia solanacearum]|nr:XRE family transcriptional regulator [Ralstonia solanacearum]
MPLKQPTTVFGRRLRDARKRANIPQDRLGVLLGLDEGTASTRISRYETGAHEPQFGVAMQLAEVLEVPAAYFYCEDDDLANVVFSWERLSKAERRHIKTLVDAKLPTKPRKA